MQTNISGCFEGLARVRSRSSGFTLVEVMVGLALSMLSMLIILQLFSVSDARKRLTTGAAEAQQTANVSVYQLGRTIRLAGSGFTQAKNVWGCSIQAYRAGTQILPAASAFPAPFASVGTTIRAIPLLILPAAAPDGQSDIVVIVAGSGETGQAELQMSAPPEATRVVLQRTNGVRGLDLILMTVPDSISDCQIAQVEPTFNPISDPRPRSLPLGTAGTTYNAPTGIPGSTYLQNSVALHLGASPIFTMFGINGNNSLEQFDLLNLSGTATAVIADNVFDMRARYGVVDPAGNGPITWQAPSVAGWQVADLTAGTAVSLALVDRIRAVRVSMVFRSTEPVKDDSPPASYVMFPDDNPITVPIPTASQLYRYQVYDTVIPLRNLRYVPNPRPS